MVFYVERRAPGGGASETQLIALREYATHRGFQIAGEYVDVGISGAKDRRDSVARLLKSLDALARWSSRTYDLVAEFRYLICFAARGLR
jgi:DNA invertase Pin-like site-specific DNA recombinase